MLRAGCFERVSTDEQSKYGFSIEAQVAALEEYCEKNNLFAQNDEGAILDIVKKAIAENEKSVADFLSGKVKAKQAIFGRIMKELKGNGDPAVIQKLLDEELSKLK